MELQMNVLVEHSLNPNEYVYLYYLVNKKLLPITLGIPLLPLQKKGYIKLLAHNKVQARQKAIDLVLEPEPGDYVEHHQEAIQQDMGRASVDAWIQEWRDLFPRSIKTGGYPVKGTKAGCTKKMKKFIKNNKTVTVEQIFEATKRYVEERRATRYQYMKIADYFIEKDGGSLLEAYVEEDDIRQKQGKTPLSEDMSSNIMADDI